MITKQLKGVEVSFDDLSKEFQKHVDAARPEFLIDASLSVQLPDPDEEHGVIYSPFPIAMFVFKEGTEEEKIAAFFMENFMVEEEHAFMIASDSVSTDVSDDEEWGHYGTVLMSDVCIDELSRINEAIGFTADEIYYDDEYVYFIAVQE